MQPTPVQFSPWHALAVLTTCAATTSCDSSDILTDPSDGPPPVRYESITAGWMQTCALSTEGQPYCWGRLTGSATVSELPVPVADSPLLLTITAGDNFTCGLDEEGQAYCWGSNDRGQFGNGTRENSAIPVRAAPGLTFSLIDAGGSHACGLTSGGAAYCWGSNSWGQLGAGSHGLSEFNPVPVVGGLSFSTLSVGEEHTCGVAAGGESYCWGWGLTAQIGDGFDSIRVVPTAVASSETFESISAGGDSDAGHTCAITRGGLVTYCWGNNMWGQLGHEASTLTKCTLGLYCRLVPTAVEGGPSLKVVAAGWTHTCGLTNQGKAYCWGAYALGNGEPALPPGLPTVFAPPQPNPMPVVGDHSFKSIAVGHDHTCAVALDGVAYCWGLNNFDVLGGSTLQEAVSPVRVLEPIAE